MRTGLRHHHLERPRTRAWGRVRRPGSNRVPPSTGREGGGYHHTPALGRVQNGPQLSLAAKTAGVRCCTETHSIVRAPDFDLIAPLCPTAPWSLPACKHDLSRLHITCTARSAPRFVPASAALPRRTAGRGRRATAAPRAARARGCVGRRGRTRRGPCTAAVGAVVGSHQRRARGFVSGALAAWPRRVRSYEAARPPKPERAARRPPRLHRRLPTSGREARAHWVRVDRLGGAGGRCSALAELHHAPNPPKIAARGHERARTAVRALAAHPAGMAAAPPGPVRDQFWVTRVGASAIFHVGAARSAA